MADRKGSTRGYLYAFLAAICGGAIPTLSKLVIPQTGPLWISGLAFFISGVMLFPVRPRETPARASVGWVVFLGVLGAALAPVTYQYGLSQTPAVNVSLLSNGEALFTSLLAFAVFGERLARGQLARGLLIAGGIVIVSTNLDLRGVQFLQGLAGNALILGSTFLWSLENNLIIAPTRRFGAVLVTKYRNVIGGGIVAILALAVGVPLSLTTGGALELVLLGGSLAATSYLAIVALADIGAIRAILVFSTTSVFGAAFALIVLGEQITAVQLGGGALILLGIYLLQRTERRVPMDHQ